MAQVSRVPLAKDLEIQMHTLFRKVLADLRSEEDIKNLLDDLLTPTEKIMLGKRLAIAFLLEKGYDQRSIHYLMRCSLATVNQVNYWFKNQGSGYRRAIAMIRKAEKWQDFLERLDGMFEEFFSKRALWERAHGMRDKEVRTVRTL